VGAQVKVNGTVGTLTANAQITVDNNGTMAKIAVNTNGVIINGNSPSTVAVAAAVTNGPKNSNGSPVTRKFSSGSTLLWQ